MDASARPCAELALVNYAGVFRWGSGSERLQLWRVRRAPAANNPTAKTAKVPGAEASATVTLSSGRKLWVLAL